MKTIIAMMAVLVLTACAGSGAIKWDDARRLKVGMTEKEVTAVMGSPYQAQGGNDGAYTWVWVDVNLLRGGSQKMTAEFKKGVVVSIPGIPESFGK